MKVRLFGFASLAAAVAAVSIGSIAHAADLQWDADGAAGAPGQDGSGNWDLTSPNWFDLTVLTNTVWQQGSNAFFGDATSAFDPLVTPNNVDIVSNIVANDITMGVGTNGGSYNITNFGGGSLTMNGNFYKAAANGFPVMQLSSALTLGAGTHTFVLRDSPGDGAGELTVNGPIGGSGGINVDNQTYESWGTLASTSDNTYAGVTTLTKGRFVITTAGGLSDTAAGTNIVDDGTLGLGGAGNVIAGGITVAEPITITRNLYTGTDYGNYASAIYNASGANVLSGPLTLSTTDARIRVDGGSLTISSNIAGTGATLSKNGGGNLILTGTNTLTNGVTLIGGELQYASDANLGGATAPITFNGGYLTVLNPATTDFGAHVINLTTFNGGISVPDAAQVFNVPQVLTGNQFNKRGLGTVNITGAGDVLTGATFADLGTINFNDASTAGTTVGGLRARNGTIVVNGKVTSTQYTSIGLDNGESGSMIVQGTGLLVTPNVDFNISDNPGSTGNLTVRDTAVLNISGSIYASKQNNTVGVITQTGGTINALKGGGTSFVLGQTNNSGTTTASGTVNKSGGVLAIAGELWVGNNLGGVGVFNQSGGSTTVANWFAIGRAAATGTVDLSGGTITKTGGGQTYVGEGANQASVINLHGTGALTINNGSGEFWLGNAGSSKGTLNVYENGALTVTNNWLAVGRNGTAQGVINLSGGSITKTGTNGFVTIGSGDTAVGTVTQTGGTFTSTQTYVGENGTGTYTVNAGNANFGALFIGRSGTNTSTGHGGTLDVSGTAVVTADAVLLGGVVTGATNANNSLTISGGRFTATSLGAGTSTGTRTFAFTGGQLGLTTYSLPLALNNTGTTTVIAPRGTGVAGSMTLSAAGTVYTQGATGALNIELGSATAADSLVVSGAGGSASLAGTLNLTLLGSYVPANYVPVTIVSAPSLTGIFGSITGVRAITNRALAVVYTGTSVTVQAALPGDADLNRTVEFADLLVVAQNYGATSGRTFATGDFDGSGGVDFNDLLSLAQFYGQSALVTGQLFEANQVSEAFQSDFALAQSLVPEPATLSVLGLTGLAALRRNRRK